jgi:hypothetical protein
LTYTQNYLQMSYADTRPRDPEKVIVELKHDEKRQDTDDLENHPFVISVHDIEKSLEQFQTKTQSENIELKEERDNDDDDDDDYDEEKLLSEASQHTLIVDSLHYFKHSNEVNQNDAATLLVTNKGDNNDDDVKSTNTQHPQIDEDEVYKRVWCMKRIVKHTDFSEYTLFVKHDCVRSFQRLLEHSLEELAHIDFERVEIEYETKRQNSKGSAQVYYCLL